MQPDLSKVKYVLFDWDGTLSDNRAIVLKAVSQVLAEHGLPSWAEIKNKRNLIFNQIILLVIESPKIFPNFALNLF